ncbi:hypothetical protein NFK58_12215 [Citrobacter portucalensis]|uniref:hypothetical protein n=1 Tax=Citrobacter portucalensis TaxID=1639133 RepID=UPI0015E94E60|nr:hypothetical protein [Citrobacter portucalensis]MBA8419857.1 hypothetical protein [Citrobacter freundii]MDE9613083.1 hypothetical protein [Citrobacter portucalensis]QMM95084.1 hypothetical protein HVW92_12150 [Citrobacter freundii]WFZ26723.1 hypothetical protein NFK58_12215 [Citrobacter portucalensis]
MDDRVYNYYGVYFSDVKQEKYQFVSLNGKNVVLEKWHAEQHAYVEKINLPLNDLEKMNVEIIHWRKQGPLRFDSIFLFTISYFTRIAYVKNMFARAKSRVFSTFSSSRELTGLDRIMLLQVLVNEYVHQSPQKTHTGVTCEEVIDLLYGTLWYKHIKNEDFRRKVFLLLQSLVITEEIKFNDEKYYIQGKAISTIVSWESEDKREKQQIRIQRNISRLMLVITASTLMITLAILTQAGLINLHNLWEHLTQLKPIRVLFKLI